jgi:hypothetical protein
MLSKEQVEELLDKLDRAIKAVKVSNCCGVDGDDNLIEIRDFLMAQIGE